MCYLLNDTYYFLHGSLEGKLSPVKSYNTILLDINKINNETKFQTQIDTENVIKSPKKGKGFQ